MLCRQVPTSSPWCHAFPIWKCTITANFISEITPCQAYAFGIHTIKPITKNKLVETINIKISNGDIEASIAKVQQKFAALSSTMKGLEASSISSAMTDKMKQVETDFTRLNQLQEQFAAGGMSNETLVSSYKEFSNILLRVSNNLTTVTASTKQFSQSLEQVTTAISSGSIEASIAKVNQQYQACKVLLALGQDDINNTYYFKYSDMGDIETILTNAGYIEKTKKTATR